MEKLSSSSIRGFKLLYNQYLIHNGKLVFISITGLITGIFVLLYSIQRITRFDSWTYEHFMYVFMGLFVVLAVLYSGASFPGLRSRSRATQYLTLPVSTTKKFLFELFTRIVLFALLMPALYWFTFYLEGQLVALIYPNFTFQSFSFTEGFRMADKYDNAMLIMFVAGQGLLFLTVPFFGATVFMKHQIVKTTAWAFGILFVFFVLFNGVIENNLAYKTILPFNCFILLLNIALVVLAYFRLKNKQV